LSSTRENNDWRYTGQPLLPVNKEPYRAGKYDIYPSFNAGDDKFFTGLELLAERMKEHPVIIIDGYSGVFFDRFRTNLETCLNNIGCSASWTETTSFLKPPDVIMSMTAPFLGGPDPLFGSRCTLDLEDFFVIDQLKRFKPDTEKDIQIIIGPGASLSGYSGLIIYIDIPKNEIQYRSRAGSIVTLGAPGISDPQSMYKCFYFVDWIVLNKHKKKILPSADIYIDGQRPDAPVWTDAGVVRNALHTMSRNLLRARPWFEPGPWGGTWIGDHIEGLNKDMPNYAWSFELITPENGLLLESSSVLLEVSFDCLMFLEAEAVLGDCFRKFGCEFPIRFDFLDTFDGGNLSVQCHPRPEYARLNFGEPFTQEEAYYILDSKEDSVVFLGFHDDVNPDKFRNELMSSFNEKKEISPEKYIQKIPSKKHDLFLIPYGTVHGSGKNNLVLEISSTPYIFTFKLYDWLRPGLNGELRTLNIERGMENLYFDRCGDYVSEKLVSKPVLIDSGGDWKLFHLPTHETHLYGINRFHFMKSIDVSTENKCLIMSLVEGSSVAVETENGCQQRFSYAETFIIPAAAGKITISNNSADEAILVFAFVK